MPQSRDPHHPNRAPTPSPQTQRLGALVGRWRSEGHIVGEVPVPITGTDIYEWLPGGFFLVHRVDVVVGIQQVQALELIGEYDPATDSFTGRAYDADGERRQQQDDGQVGAQRRRRQLAAVDGHDLHPDDVTGGGRSVLGRAPSDASSAGSTDESGRRATFMAAAHHHLCTRGGPMHRRTLYQLTWLAAAMSLVITWTTSSATTRSAGR